VRVKAGTVASFSFADLTDGKYSRGFNLSTNQWAASGGSVEFTNYTVTPNIDGWFLVSAIYTPTGATGGKAIAFLLGGTTLGQTVSFDTPQLEAGSFPTSYIPTTTGTLARSADVCSITGGNFNNFYNQSEGTMFSASTRLRPTGQSYSGIVSANDGTNDNRVAMSESGNPNDILFAVFAGGVPTYLRAVTNAVGLARRVALAYSQNSTNSAYNGAIGIEDTSSILPAVTNMAFNANQTISAIRYYKKRLPNAKLVTLTT